MKLNKIALFSIKIGLFYLKQLVNDMFGFNNFNFGIGTFRLVSVSLVLALFRDLLLKKNKVLNVQF